MATKVFKRGGFVVGQEDAKPEINFPQEAFDFSIIPTTPTDYVQLIDNVQQQTITVPVTDIQNESGTPIGDTTAVKNYLSGLKETTVSSGTLFNVINQFEFIDPSTESIENWKRLDIFCSGTIGVTIEGETITYPYTLGSLTVYGPPTLVADTESETAVEIDGTGTALVYYTS